jgi:cysteine desulfurase family protein
MKALAKRYANAGRGGHKLAFEASTCILNCREELADFFTAVDPARIAFTSNTTEALNYAIHGTIRSNKDHIIISAMEHNSVTRPAYASGAVVDIAHADSNGRITADSIAPLICADTRLIAITHASNICGTINPIDEIGALAHEKDILFLVDSAQTAGVLPINVLDLNIDFLAFAGHKMLFGPQGTGGLYVGGNIDLKPLKQGGTGSMSESKAQPTFMPDVLESGTLNAGGIAGLNEGVKFVKNVGIKRIRAHEQELTKLLLDAFADIPQVIVYGDLNAENRVGVVGFNIPGRDCVELANCLSMRYNIATRGGFHCAALAHKSMGTNELGMVRASFSWFTKKSDVLRLIDAVLKEVKAENPKKI